jgi:hypothetical protein
MLVTYFIQVISFALMGTLFVANGVKTARVLSKHKGYWYDFQRVNAMVTVEERRQVKKYDRSNLVYATILLFVNVLAGILFKGWMLF